MIVVTFLDEGLMGKSLQGRWDCSIVVLTSIPKVTNDPYLSQAVEELVRQIDEIDVIPPEKREAQRPESTLQQVETTVQEIVEQVEQTVQETMKEVENVVQETLQQV